MSADIMQIQEDMELEEIKKNLDIYAKDFNKPESNTRLSMRLYSLIYNKFTKFKKESPNAGEVFYRYYLQQLSDFINEFKLESSDVLEHFVNLSINF